MKMTLISTWQYANLGTYQSGYSLSFRSHVQYRQLILDFCIIANMVFTKNDPTTFMQSLYGIAAR